MWQIMYKAFHQGNEIYLHALFHSFVQETFIELLLYAFTVLGTRDTGMHMRNWVWLKGEDDPETHQSTRYFLGEFREELSVLGLCY